MKKVEGVNRRAAGSAIWVHWKVYRNWASSFNRIAFVEAIRQLDAKTIIVAHKPSLFWYIMVADETASEATGILKKLIC